MDLEKAELIAGVHDRRQLCETGRPGWQGTVDPAMIEP
jgi:hypothetical protein